MNRHAKFWLTIGSFLSLAGLVALMILIVEYAKLTGHATEIALLTTPPLIYSFIQMIVNYIDMTEGE